MKPDKTLELLLPKANLDLALGKLYQAGIFTLQHKIQQGKVLIVAELPNNTHSKTLVSWLRTQKDLKQKKLFTSLLLKTSKDRSWEKAYQKHLKPFIFLKENKQPLLWIDPQEYKKVPLQKNTLYLKAGLAFGTGGHPTTQLAAEMMQAILRNQKVNKDFSLLDMGCGSALLAFSANKLGVKEIWAIDNDPIAIKVARENCELNQMKNLKFALNFQKVKNKKFDIIVANILLPVLQELKADFEKHLKKEGTLIVSGLLYKDCDPLLKHYKGWNLVERQNRKGWSALKLKIDTNL